MKQLIKKAIPVLLILITLLGCDNSPNSLASIRVDSYESEIRITDYEKGIELTKAPITALYIKGNEARVSNVAYSATVKSGESAKLSSANSMIALAKGVYTVSATYTEGSLSKTAYYDVSVTGDERLIISSIKGNDLFDGDSAEQLEAIAKIEREDGRLEDATNLTYTIKDSSGNVKAKTEKLSSGIYSLTVSLNNASATHEFSVSKGLLPISFSLEKDTIPSTFNKERDTLDLRGLSVTVNYQDELDTSRKTTKTIALFENGALKDGVSITLGGKAISDYSKVSFASFNKGDVANLEIKVDKAFAKAVKTDGTPTSFSSFSGVMESYKKEIKVTVNPKFASDLIIKTNEGTSDLEYVENDSVDLKNITISYDDGTGAALRTIRAEEAAVSLNGSPVSGSFKLKEGDNTISLTYNGIVESKTIKAEKIAKAKAINSASGITYEYRVNTDNDAIISIPDSLTLNVTYEDGTTGDVKVEDKSKVTFSFTRQDSIATFSLNNNSISGDSTLALSADDAGKYKLNIKYSSPEDFTHRQSKSISDSDRYSGDSLEKTLDSLIDVKKSAIISNLNIAYPESLAYQGYAEGDIITPSDATFEFTNIFGDKDSSLDSADDANFTLEYKVGSEDWKAVPSNGYALTSAATTFRVRYFANDQDNDNYTVSEEKTIEPHEYLRPSKIEINNKESFVKTINVEGSIGSSYSIESLSITLTYPDDEKKENVAVIEGGKVNENFSLSVAGSSYDAFKYSYATLGEQDVVITLINASAYNKRPAKEAKNIESSVSDSYKVTLERDPIIKDAKLDSNLGTLYNHSTIDLSDVSFTYVDKHGRETSITLDNNSVSDIKVDDVAQSGNITLPNEYKESYTLTFSYLGTEGSLLLSNIAQDTPSSLTLSGEIETEYKATSPTFSNSLSDTLELSYLSGWKDSINKSSLSFKVGDKDLVAGESAILKANEGEKISVFYNGYKVYETNAINYNAVSSLKVKTKENTPLAIVKDSDVTPSTFIESVILVFEDNTEESYSAYTFSAEGSTSELRAKVKLTPSVTINGDTVKDEQSAITVQVVQNEYEVAGYFDSITLSANSNTPFKTPDVFNRANGDVILFTGYYDESGRYLSYGQGDIYVDASGKTTLTDNYATGYEAAVTIYNTTNESVVLHPAYIKADEIATVSQNSLLKSDNSSDANYEIIGIPNSIESIGSTNSTDALFHNNKNIRMVVFEKNSAIKTFGNRALCNMDLRYVEIPSSLERFEEAALADHSNTNSEVILHFEDNSSTTNYGIWAFSGSGVKNLYIPKSATAISDTAFINNTKLECIIIEERDAEFSLPNSAFNGSNVTLESLYIPANIALSANSLSGLSINTLVINAQQNTSSFASSTPWGAASINETKWLIENAATASIKSYDSTSAYEKGGTFSAIITEIASNGDTTDKDVIINIPSTAQSKVPFTYEYTISGTSTTVNLEFTLDYIVDAIIRSADDLAQNLAQNKNIYIENSFETDGFTVPGGMTIEAKDGVTLTLANKASGSDYYIVLGGDDITIDGVDIELKNSDTTSYILYASNISGLDLKNFNIDSAVINAGGIANFVNVSGNITSVNTNGNNRNELPYIFDGCTLKITSSVLGQDGGTYGWSRFAIKGEANDITFVNMAQFDRYATSGENNSPSNIKFENCSWGSGPYTNPTLADTKTVSEVVYSIYNPTSEQTV